MKKLILIFLLLTSSILAQSFGYTQDPVDGVNTTTDAREYCGIFTTGSDAAGGQIDSIRYHASGSTARITTWAIRNVDGSGFPDSLLATQVDTGFQIDVNFTEQWFTDTVSWNTIVGGLENNTTYALCMISNQEICTFDYDDSTGVKWSFSNTGASGMPSLDPADFDTLFDYFFSSARQEAMEIWFTVTSGGSSSTKSILISGDVSISKGVKIQ